MGYVRQTKYILVVAGVIFIFQIALLSQSDPGMTRETGEQVIRTELKVKPRSTRPGVAHTTMLYRTNRTTPKPPSVISPYIWRFLVLPKDPCPADDIVHLLCIVPTDPHKFEARMTVRNSWGSSDNYKWMNVTVRTVFVMGVLKNVDIDLTEKLQTEIETYKDIVIGDFVDDYYNLTTKMRVAFRYASQYCADAVYTLKIDDDVLLDVFQMFKFLYKYMRKTNFFACYALYDKLVLRDQSSKWYIPESLYALATYPPYCNGPMYLMPRGMSSVIDEHAAYVKPFPFEDITFTGFVREAIGNVRLVDLKHQTLLWEEKRLKHISEFILVQSLATHRVREDFYWNVWERKKQIALRKYYG